jgi:hypothetical protein
MDPVDHGRRHVARAALAAVCGGGTLLAGCAGGMLGDAGADGAEASAPDLSVGDRWNYRCSDGFRNPVVWDETHEVIAADAQGYRVRIVARGPTIDYTRVEDWATPGLIRGGAATDFEMRHYTPPMIRYRFPLARGVTWNQWLDNVHEATRDKGLVNRYGRVGGWRSISVAAGTFDAIFVNILMTMDDETFWRNATRCNYGIWWAPAVGAPILEDRQAEYREKGGLDAVTIRSQSTRIELVSFVRAR